MTIDLTDTSTGAIYEALTEARRRLGGPALGMVLTLIVETSEDAQYDAMRSANQAGREHPCRVLGVITRRPKAPSRLDAEIRVGETGPGETILLRLYGPVGQHTDSVLAPLLVPDVPVVTWWPGQAPEVPSQSPLGALAQRRVTDAASGDNPQGVLADLAEVYKPGDSDFAWTRLTPWRTLLAATLDVPHPPIVRAEILAERDNPSGDMLAGWLSVRLGVPVRRGDSDGPGITDVRFETLHGHIGISRHDGRTATLSKTGEPDRRVALHRREQAELLAEELRRLDPDDVYGESLAWLFSDARTDDSPESPDSDTFTLTGRSAVAEQATADQRLAEQVRAGAPERGLVDAAATAAMNADEGETAVESEQEVAGQ